jgi:hypothetical protein
MQIMTLAPERISEKCEIFFKRRVNFCASSCGVTKPIASSSETFPPSISLSETLINFVDYGQLRTFYITGAGEKFPFFIANIKSVEVTLADKKLRAPVLHLAHDPSSGKSTGVNL